MGLFSRKSRSKKDLGKDVEQTPIEVQPKKKPAKFVPRHGGAAGRTYPHEDASSMIHETISSPPSPNFQRAPMNLVYGENGYYNNVPPVPPRRSRLTVQNYSANSHAHGKQPIIGSHYVPYNNSSDSGYESAEPMSAMHSRVPSEHNLHDSSKAYVEHDTLPELRLDGDSNTLGMDISSIGKSGDNVSPLDLNSDARSIKSNRSVSKRTRFEDDAGLMPSLERLEQHRKESDQASSSSPALRARPDHASAFVPLEKPHSQATSLLHPGAIQTSHQSRSIRRGSVPPLSILEGFKVNKKGKILDEEGEPIGELIHGDLLDCVRQKANASGDVIDEYGRIVGRVRTCAPSSSPVHVAPELDVSQLFGAQMYDFQAASGTSQSQAAAPPVKNAVQREAPKVMAHPQDVSVHDTTDQLDVESPVIQSAAVMQASSSTPDSKRVSRSASEKSLSELSKTYARPTMSSVPENNVPEDDAAPVSPGIFAYKGSIPVTDGPIKSNRRSRSPPQPAQLLNPVQIMPGQAPGPAHYAKLALVGGHSNSTLYAPMRPSNMNSRRMTTQFSGGPVPIQRLPPVLKKTTSNNFAFDATPSGSDAGSDPSSSDEGRMLTMGHSRTGSVNTTATVSKPRTYFSHAGKIIVTADRPSTAAAAPEPAPAPVAPETTMKKKKSRMSMGFSRKSKVAA